MPANSTSTSTPDVISDTTPLICLAGLGLLAILPKLFITIMVPQQVLAEYQAGISIDGRPALAQFPWIIVTQIALRDEVVHLDIGEAAALSLARDRTHAALLLDDRDARRAAHRRAYSECNRSVAVRLGLPIPGWHGPGSDAQRLG